MSAKRLAIIAGSGDLPSEVIDSCLGQGKDFFILALDSFTDKKIVEGKPHKWVRLGAIGKALKILHQEKITEVIMAGNIRRPSLKELRPDLRGMAFFAKIGSKALGDDGFLTAVVSAMEEEGFKIIGAHDICKNLLTPIGIMGKHKPKNTHLSDVKQGYVLAKELGRMDVGQAVVVQNGLILGLEAIEGTDALIQRCSALKRKGDGPILIKCCKPEQETRVDMPTIGLKTVENAIKAGFSGVALEAGKTLFLERKKSIELANEAGLFLLGVNKEDVE